MVVSPYASQVTVNTNYGSCFFINLAILLFQQLQKIYSLLHVEAILSLC